MNYLKYTNGVGHLIMSIVMDITGLLLVLLTVDATVKAIGITLILAVQAAWFIPGSAKQVAYEVVKQVQKSTTAPLPASVNNGGTEHV